MCALCMIGKIESSDRENEVFASIRNLSIDFGFIFGFLYFTIYISLDLSGVAGVCRVRPIKL